jgi:flavodoxin
MKTEIYYFSGTGNSLAVARDIALETILPGACCRTFKPKRSNKSNGA